MQHNEARTLLAEAYEKTHDAKGIAQAYGVSVPTVYRLAEQKAKTGNIIFFDWVVLWLEVGFC